MQKDGLLHIYTNRVEVTKKGKPFIRNVCMAFDLMLQQRQPDTPKFSMTV